MTITDQDKEILAASRGTVRDRRRTPRIDHIGDIVRKLHRDGIKDATDFDWWMTGEHRPGDDTPLPGDTTDA
jgi:hypothetical protein